MPRWRNKISISVPQPNKNRTMSMGNKVVVDSVFRDTGLNGFLNGLKRSQGEDVSDEVNVNSAVPEITL